MQQPITEIQLNQVNPVDFQNKVTNSSQILPEPVDIPQEYDPFEGLSHLEKLKVRHELASSDITPYNQTDQIQVFFNPLTPTENKEVISVQFFTPSVMQFKVQEQNAQIKKDQEAKSNNYRGNCLEGHPLESMECTSELKCKICDETIVLKKIMYICSKTKQGVNIQTRCEYQICQPCNIRHYIRQNLLHQTSLHHMFKSYKLFPVKQNTNQASLAQIDTGNESEGNSVEERLAESKRIKSLEEKLGDLSQKFPKSLTKTERFANVLIDRTIYEENSNITALSKYVLIGLWRMENGYYNCYRVFRADKPAFLSIKQNDRVDHEFFHINEEQLVYFTKQKFLNQYTLTCNFFDLKAAMAPTDDKLIKLDSYVFKSPVQKTYVFQTQEKVHQLLNKIFVQSITLVNKIQIQGNTIAITAPFAWADDQKLWVRTSYGRNIIFINLENQSIPFTIYKGDLLLQLTYKDNQPSTVFFMRNKSFVEMEWNQKPSKSEITQEYLTNQVGIWPKQQYVRNYAFMPRNEKNFILLKNDLYDTIEGFNSSESLVMGEIHSLNRQRITINYSDGGLFTFQLQLKSELQESCVWLGEIGEIKNFKIDKFSIIDNIINGSGYDDRGSFTVCGQLEAEKISWQGYYQLNNNDNEMTFDYFSIKENKVRGKGQDLVGIFTIKGHLDGDAINFTKHHSSHSMYFTGQMNQEHTKIIGSWRFHEQGRVEDVFQMTMNSSIEVNLKISYQNQKLSWINLGGSFEKKRASIEGNYTCSKDIEPQITNPKARGSVQKFSLWGVNHQDSAVVQFSSTEMNDATFFWTKSKDGKSNQLFAAGNLRFKQQAILVDGYNSVDVDLINLDSENLHEKPEKKTIVIQLPETFSPIVNSKGVTEMPYFIIKPFNCKYNKDGQFSIEGQMFYYDQHAHAKRMLFINGTELTEIKFDPFTYQNKMLLPQWPPIMSDNYTVIYPIIAYKSNLPSDNQIVIVNMAKNVPQKYINISPFKFVQFIETGINPERGFNPDTDMSCNTSIFFLVSFQEHFYIMIYRCYPWPVQNYLIDPQNAYRLQLQDQLQIVTGKISLKQVSSNLNPLRIMCDKIQCAGLIQRKKSNGVQSLIVFQLIDQIICFNLTNSELQFVQQKETMLKNFMCQGPNDQIYFAEQNETGIDCIVQLEFIEKAKATKNIIYRCDSAKVLQLQVDMKMFSKHSEEHYVYILDSESKLRRFHIDSQSQDKRVYQDKKLDLTQNPGFLKLTNFLLASIWTRIIVREKSIVFLKQQSNNPQDGSCQFVMSPTSELNYFQPHLGFNDDFKIACMKKNVDYVKQESTVLSMAKISWIGKNLFEVRDAQQSFFMVTDQYASRRKDMMRIDSEQMIRESLILIGNRILALKLKYTNQYLFYDQKSFSFMDSYQARNLQILTHVQDGVQFFAADDVKSTSIELDTVIKFTRKETKLPLYLNVRKGLLEINTNFLQQIKTINPDITINFQDKQWYMNHENEHILGVLAFAYSAKAALPLPESQFNGNKIELQVQIINKSINQLPRGSSDNRQSLLKASKTVIQSIFEEENSLYPTVVLAQCKHWEKPENVNECYSAVMTKNYLVIKHGFHLVFAKLQEIEEKNEAALQLYNKADQTYSQRFVDIFKDEFCKIQFDLLDMSVLSPYITSNGFVIELVDDYNLNIAEKGEIRTNVIQISFKNVQIMWDLDENKEVTFLQQPEQFNDPIAYVTTGFTPRRFLNPKIKQMHATERYTQNEYRSFILTPDIPDYPSQLMRTYSYLNLLEVLHIKKRFENNLAVNAIDLETMLQNFGGLTFFQIFRDKRDFLDLLEDKIEAEGIKDDIFIDETGEEQDNIIIRMIYWTLNIPVIKEGINEKIFAEMKNKPSLIQLIINEHENQHLMNNYMRIIMLSREYRLSNLIPNFQSFVKTFEVESKAVQRFLQEAHFENSESRNVESLMWNPDHSLITFGSNHSLLNQDQIQQEVYEQQIKKMNFFSRIKQWMWPNPEVLTDDLKTYPVQVKIMEIEWLSENLKDFYMYLNNVNDDTMFGNEFIKVLLEQQNYTDQLVVKVFIPYLVNVILNLIYFSRFIPFAAVKGGFFGDVGFRTQGAIRTIIVIGSITLTAIEINQIYKQGLGYLSDFWNYIFWTSNILSIVIVILHGCQSNQVGINALIQMSSVAIVLQWCLLYYWMRLFPSLAFYVTMISETFKDISHFFLMFVMCIAMFSNAAYVLNLIQPESDADGNITPFAPLWNDAFGVPFIDSFFNQYQLGLGNFYLDPYASNPAAVLILIYFILATLFTQIMFLNMLIAIMSETFSRVSESKERSALMERTHLYADFMWGIKLSQELKGMRYLYIVRPVEENPDEDALQIEQVQKRLTKLITEKMNKITEDQSGLQRKVELILTSNYAMKTDLNQKFDKIMGLLKAK